MVDHSKQNQHNSLTYISHKLPNRLSRGFPFHPIQSWNQIYSTIVGGKNNADKSPVVNFHQRKKRLVTILKLLSALAVIFLNVENKI